MKLLHERLRDGELDYCIGEKAGEVLADEIERYYVPRPRFEDGEPVQFGDTAIGELVLWVVKSSADIEGQRTEENRGKVTGYTFDDGEQPWIRIIDDEGDIIEVRPPEGNDCFKRPQHKILDADGVEIKVGDTVWFMYGDHHKFVVDRVYKDNSLGWIVADGGDKERYFQPTKLTHKEPDSLQKLLTDMEDLQEVDDVVSEWVARLSALIERGA